MRKPEILAPAGSLESLKGAIAAGCDAVYMGGKSFGARAYAKNLSEEEMVEAIRFCHLHDVKLYLTVNTLLTNQEIKQQLYSYLLPYYEAGLDAVIVQDVGVMSAIHTWFEDLPIHASTQMNLTLAKGLERLKSYGVTRIVPARELSLAQLKQMRQDSCLEMEVFVHGALCYCYSGQCLLSSMQGGRSGNRGRCAQPCRMKYDWGREQGYLLSTKELCNLPMLDKLMQTGIDSLKIEGRMKQPQYTAFVTAIYRKYVDLCASLGIEGYQTWKKENAKEWERDLGYLAELYNREGFTSGYLEGSVGNPKQSDTVSKVMLSINRPNHGGVEVGTVKQVGPISAQVKLTRDIFAQDVLEFRNAKGESLYEYTVGQNVVAGQKIPVKFKKGSGIKPGNKLFRTRHQVLLDEIHENYLSKRLQVPVEGEFIASEGNPCLLTLRTGNEWITCQGEVVSAAQNHPAKPEEIKKRLSQTGESDFYFVSLSIDLQGDLFLPVGMLKQLRRQAFAQLLEHLQSRGRRCVKTKEISHVTISPKKMPDENTMPTGKASIMSSQQLAPLLASDRIQEIILRLDTIPVSQVPDMIARIHAEGKKAWIGMPRIFHTSAWETFQTSFNRMVANGFDRPEGYLVSNMESFHFLQTECGILAKEIQTDANLYVMNDFASDWWKQQGVSKMTVPYECTKKQLLELADFSMMDMVVYGNLIYMVSAQCVTCNTEGCQKQSGQNPSKVFYQDQKGRKFVSVACCQYCYNLIYGLEPLWLVPQLQTLSIMPAGIRYEFTIESEKQISMILEGQLPVKPQIGHWELGVT